MTTNKILLAILFCLFSLSLFGQNNVGIGTETPNPKAILDIESSSKGLLAPRLTTLQRNSIAPGATEAGLMVYDTDLESYMYFDGVAWSLIGDKSSRWSDNINGIHYLDGNVGIGTANPARKLHLINNDEEISAFFQNSWDGNGSKYGIYNYLTEEGVGNRYGIYNNISSNNATGPTYGIYSTLATTGATGNMYGMYSFISSSGTGNHYALYGYASGENAYGIYAYNNSSDGYAGYFNGYVRATDRVVVGTGEPYNGLTVNNRDFYMTNADTNTVRIRYSGVGTGGEAEFYMNNGFRTLELQASETATTGSQIQMYKSNGTLGISLDADFLGMGRIITEEIEVTGADLAENYPINKTGILPKAGMLLSIDPNHPGKLMTSTQAYDKKLAGIVSGANGIRPGVIMGGDFSDDKEGQIADPDEIPIALAGRVYVYASAENGAIEPGDLLTSSSTPGYAMKVTDYPRAQGAIIGKAMSKLDKGQGFVLVLVNLQ